MTILHAGGKFGGEGYKVSGGLHGVGVSCVNALSKRLVVRVARDGNIYEMEFSARRHHHEAAYRGPCRATRARRLRSGPMRRSSKRRTVYDFSILESRFREMAFLNKGLKLTLTDMRQKDEDGNPKSETFQYEGGISDFVKYLNSGRETLDPIIDFEAESADGEVEVAMQWSSCVFVEFRAGVREQYQYA